jgi:hypothetical protein
MNAHRPGGAAGLRGIAILFGTIAIVIAAGAAPRAHEIGTTRVGVTFPDDRSYRIELVTDAGSLLEKLEAASGRSRSGASSADDLRQRIAALQDTLFRRISVQFDGAAVSPDVWFEVREPTEPGGVPGAAIVLTGERPAAATSFTWTFGWTFASYALRVQTRGGEPVTQWIEGADTSAPVTIGTPPSAVARPTLALRYVLLGFTHILPKGLDHVLFVLGVFLLSRRVRPILWQVSAFTIAHSITLGLSMYGIVSIAPSIVEPLIALSIAYIAVENLLLSEFRPWRVGLVFAFGLLHGLGFAGALREVGLPRSEFATALVGFNVGVELGQLAVISAAFLAVGYWYGDRIWYRRRIVMPASACIACFGMFWMLQRLHLA